MGHQSCLSQDLAEVTFPAHTRQRDGEEMVCVNLYHLPTGRLWLPGLVASGTRCSAGVWKHSAPAGEGGLTT